MQDLVLALSGLVVDLGVAALVLNEVRPGVLADRPDLHLDHALGLADVEMHGPVARGPWLPGPVPNSANRQFLVELLDQRVDFRPTVHHGAHAADIRPCRRA